MVFRTFRYAAGCLAAVFLLSAAVLVGPSGALSAQATPDSQELLPFDSAVRTGTLPNGLTYFIRRNGRPANRITLRLAVKAGSIDEADDQQGLAHLIEHMAFNGSAHFKPGEIFSYFESVGARLGPHVNARTGFDDTVYMLDLPSDKREVVFEGLSALADFGGGLTLDAKEIEKERGVVIEEWRGGLGASSRVRDKQIPVLFYESLYAQRLPIGKPDVIRSAPPERLRSFYDTWYRPERMAVVAVGDFVPSRIETDIRTAFSPLKARGPAAPDPDTSVPIPHPLLVSVTTDPELTESSVEVMRKRPSEGSEHVGDYRRSLVRRMIEQMMDERFSELAHRPDAKFLAASAGDGPLSPTVDAFVLDARVADGDEDGVAVLAEEAKRVREFGFNASEVGRAKLWITSYYDRAYNERDKTESGSFAQEYLDFFLEKEPSPGITYEYALVKQLLPSITLEETTTLSRELLADDSRILVAVSPQKPDIRIPSDAQLQAALIKAEQVTVTAWNDTGAVGQVMRRKPRPATIESRREIREIGVTVLKFSNGVEAWLKPTDFKNDQLLFSLDAKGGASLAAPEDYLEASLSPTFVGLSGVGGRKALDLRKLLTGKIASASPFVALSTHGIGGSAAPADLETSLQLLYQTFVAPGNDPDAFTLMKRQLDASVANRDRSPMDIFGERIGLVNTSNHYTAQPPSAERVAALSREKMIGFYRDRFKNAADFTFFMVGSFKINEAVPLLASYVGGLPSTGTRTSDFNDVGRRFPTDVQRVQVDSGREPRSETVISFFADAPPTPMEQERIAEASVVLEIALREVLREDLGQTYTVSVGLSQALPQRGDGYMSITFGASPANVETMITRVLEEVKQMQDAGPSDDLTNRAKESAKRDYETALRQNGYWIRRLEATNLFGTDPVDIMKRAQRIDAVSPSVLQDTFKRYFPFGRYTVVTLMPAPADR